MNESQPSRSHPSHTQTLALARLLIYLQIKPAVAAAAEAADAIDEQNRRARRDRDCAGKGTAIFDSATITPAAEEGLLLRCVHRQTDRDHWFFCPIFNIRSDPATVVGCKSRSKQRKVINGVGQYVG